MGEPTDAAAAPPPWLPLLAVVALGLGARLLVTFASGLPWWQVDSDGYAAQAQALARGEWGSFTGNGYPALIALVAAVAGWGEGLPRALVLLNVALSTAVVPCVYFLCRRRACGERAALCAALAVALWPSQLNAVRLVMTEAACAFFLTAGVCLAAHGRPVAGHLLLGFAALVRNSLLPALPLLALAWLAPRRTTGALLVAACLFVPLALHEGVALARRGDPMPGTNMRFNVVVAVHSMGEETDTDNVAFGDGPSLAAALTFYARHARDAPGTFLAQRAASLWTLWGPLPRREPARSWPAALLIGLRFPLLVLALAGFLAARPRRRTDDWYLLVPALVVTVLHVMLFSRPRHTNPVEPALVVLAAGGVAWLRAARARREDAG